MSGLVVSHDESIAVATTWTRGGPRGYIIGSLLRIWRIATDVVEDHAIAPPGFFSVVPWPEDRFALLRHPVDDPEPPEADALVAQGNVPRVSIRAINNPLVDLALARITSDNRLELEGHSSAWDVPPSLVPLGFPLVLRVGGGDVTVHRIGVVPRSSAWGDGDAYRLTPLSDGKTVLLSHTRFGDELLVVDVLEDAVIARTTLDGVSPNAVESLSTRNEVWIGQHDQLLRFDPAQMTVKKAVRLPNHRSGSFINALRFNTSEDRCAVSHALRSPDPGGAPVARPSGGRILSFDVHSFEVVGSVDAPGWIDDLALLSMDRVCGQLWGGGQMWLARISAAEVPLLPPRAPGERDWT